MQDRSEYLASAPKILQINALYDSLRLRFSLFHALRSKNNLGYSIANRLPKTLKDFDSATRCTQSALLPGTILFWSQH